MEGRIAFKGVEGRGYRLLFDAIQDYAICMLDLEGRVVSWNMGAQRLGGYAPAEIIGKSFSYFYQTPDRAAGLPENALQVAAAEGKFEAESWQQRKDGSSFRADVVINPVHDEEGKHIGFAQITRDLSERIDAATTLGRSEDQFRLLVQSVTDYAIYMLDATGRVSSWNPGARHIKGYEPAEIIGQHFSRFYTEEDRAAGEPQRALATAAREGRFATDGWRVRKDGTRFLASVVIDPIRDDDGKLIGFAKITRDLTERALAQKQLEDAREALFQSQKLDAIGRLTGGVAHDFNNLLMATLSSLDLLRRYLPDVPQAHRLLNNAIQGAERGATLTQRMLAFARRQDLVSVRLEIPELVRGLNDLIAHSLGSAIMIETRFPLGLEAVIGDVNQLEMALLNLLVNARDAMPDGGLITISAENRLVQAGEAHGLTPGKYIALSVIDQGSGMDQETLNRATEPFFTTKGVGKGTGLGLAMVHGLAEQLGGRFILESELGKGTSATLWLPASEKADAQEAGTPRALQTTRPLTVLAVDDDSLVLMNTVALLQDLGHTVLEAQSGLEALAVFQRESRIDLVITDQAMPVMSGLQFAAAALAERPDTPFILATGYGELPDEADARIGRLKKPFRQVDLAQAIAAAMQGCES